MPLLPRSRPSPRLEPKAYAQAHGQSGVLEAADAAHMQSLQRTLSERGISAALRFVNDPSRIKGDNAFYRNMLRGSCCDSAWRRRRGSRWWRRTDICRSSETMVTPNPVGGICGRSGW